MFKSSQAMATGDMASVASTTETFLVVAVAMLVIYLTCKMLHRKSKSNLPPGPLALPIIGSLHLLGTHPHQNLAAMARKYGPVMSMQLGQKLCIIATSPDAAKEFLKLQDANFCYRPRVRAAQLLMPQDIVFNDNTNVFRHLRKLMQGELTSAKRLEASKHIRSEEVSFMLHSIAREAPGSPIHLKHHLNVMATNILSRMVLNKRFLSCDEVTDEVREFRDIVEGMLHCFAAIHPKDFFSIPDWLDPMGLDKRFRKQRARMDAFYEKMVSQHREYRKRKPVVEEREKTMLDVLLECVENEPGVTEEHAKGVVWDVFSAGTDTSVLTSEWTMAEVLRAPSVMKKAQDELDQVVGRSRSLQESDLPRLPYLSAVVNEALRLHAPLPLLLHMSVAASQVLGFDIPARTRVFINVWGISRDPSSWEEPLAFRPERFLPGGPREGQKIQAQQFAFLPFGSGRRACPGMAFGSVAVALQVGSLLHAFEWQAQAGEVEMAEGKSFTVAMATPLVAKATERGARDLYRCTLTAEG